MRVTSERPHDDTRLRSGTVNHAGERVGGHVGEIEGGKPVDPERQADFARAVEDSQARRQQGGTLRERVERLAQPSPSDPSLYGNERSIELLQHVTEVVLPGMDVSPEIADLAAQLINEEVTQRLEWAARRAEAEEYEP
ncbi:hypothetical protein HOP51_09755 [Halomonas sp. MCCC 1A11036]|uniref:Uncharacterized protein n=1 Tax=Billgrantia zhangzhouensis TaxID=2733481 RepID=A0ABS9AFA5_9GAMM|nr:hypothetical protein [Halomonas zhangzhouensis]MCE8020387.1 hypothetical protein [Halomonas zhangzhouensis]